MVKKNLIILISLIFCINPALAADISLLYKINNTNSEQLKQIITPVIEKKSSNVIKNNDFFIIEKQNTEFYSIIILKNTENDSYFYFLSNKNDETLKDEILNALKNNYFNYKTVRDANLKSYFYNQAYSNLSMSTAKLKTVKNTNTVNTQPKQADIDYDFSDEAQKNFNMMNGNLPPVVLNEPKNQISIPQKVIKLPEINPSNINSSLTNSYNINNPPQKLIGGIVLVTEGETITAGLLSNITSDGLVNNDRISAELDRDWIYNGVLIAPQGSILNGYAVDTKASGLIMANGQIGLEFNELMTPDGNIIPLTSNRVYIIGDTNRAINITKRVGAGAAVGLVISALSMMAGADPAAALISGLAIGAGGGALTAVTSKGEEVQVLEGSQIQITLTEPLTIPPYRQ